MLAYIETNDERLCCGCRACEQICPVNAITMEINEEGFLYPFLNRTKCISCNLCEKCCPMMNMPKESYPLSIYAVQHKDEEVLNNSSSGGVFRLAADTILELGGCVVGCRWDNNYHPVFSIANSTEDLLNMQGSKYLSSDTLDIYKQTKEKLIHNKYVLFTGAPCQCAGLLNFLDDEYDNLFVADFLCHGMPSQTAFDSHLNDLCINLNGNKKNIDKSIITSYKFRDKSKKGWGHVISYTWEKNNKVFKRYKTGMLDDYDVAFLKGYLNRYSCYKCPFRGEQQISDITFSDYWGVQYFHPEIDASKGVSALSINSAKGMELFNRFKHKALCIETDRENVAKENPGLLFASEEEIPELRYEIYKILKNYRMSEVAKKYFRDNKYWMYKIINIMPQSIINLIKKVIH